MAPGDTEKDAEQLASKVLKLRLWDGEDGGRVGTCSTEVSMFDWEADCWQWKQSVQDINGEVLCGKHSLLFASSSHAHISPVSQFTLLASTKRGTKPDFHGALGGDEAKKLYDVFFSKVQENYKAERVKDGVFQAMMVSFCCEGLILLLIASLGSSPCE